jgi:hypothetical protein
MSIEASFITGFMVGLEFIDFEDEEGNQLKSLVIDIGIIRLMFFY